MSYGNGGQMNVTAMGLSGLAGFASQGIQAPATQVISIPNALDGQSKAVIDLHDTIAQLEARLQVILGPDQTAEPPVGTAPAPNPIQVVDRVMDHNRGIGLAMSRLHRLMQRLQL